MLVVLLIGIWVRCNFVACLRAVGLLELVSFRVCLLLLRLVVVDVVIACPVRRLCYGVLIG